MREKLARFMVGRNGADALSKFFLYVALVLVIITMFSHNAIIYLLAIASLVYSYFRMMKKIYKIYYCPSCKQKIRVPKGKGKIMITCPKCKMEFVKRT